MPDQIKVLICAFILFVFVLIEFPHLTVLTATFFLSFVMGQAKQVECTSQSWVDLYDQL